MVFGLSAYATSGSVFDVDSYWHVLIGRDIWVEQRFTGNPAWVFGPHQDAWVTTQWLSEVLMAGLVHVAGWAGLTVLRVVAGISILVLLANRTLRGSGSTFGRTVVFAAAGFAVMADVQERPAALSFIFLVVVGGWARTALQDGIWPVWWKLALTNLLWVNLHGYWVLLPVAIAVVAVARALENRTLHDTRRPILLAAVTSVVGIASPAGVYVFVAPLTVSSAASPFIQEWGRTSIVSGPFCAFLVLVALCVAGWARSLHVPVGEQIFIALLVLFALLAFRNVLPAVLLMAPVAAARAAISFPSVVVRGGPLSASLTVLILISCTGLGLARLSTGSPFPNDVPLSAYAALEQAPGEHRVLNYYDLGGQVLALTRPGVRVAVDGRADLYGPQRLARYHDLLATRPGWQKTLSEYAPTDALLPVSAPLVERLAERGWKQRPAANGYVLLTSPAA